MSTALSAALLILIISACLRAVDNMISTTVPLLGTYVFGLGTIYGGIFSSIYGGSALFSNWVINPRLTGTVRRRVFIGCAGIPVAAAFLLPSATAVTTLLLGVAAGLAIGILYTNLAASAAGYAKLYHNERLISIYALGFSISLILGPLLESYLLAISYTAVFLVFGCIAIAAFVLSFRMRLSNIARMTSSRMSPLAKRGLLEGILTGAIFFVPFGALSVFLPIYAKSTFDISTTLAYSSYIPLYTVSLLVRLLMVARPLRRIDYSIIISMIITVGGLVGMFLAPSFALFLVVIGLFGIPHGITFTLSLILVSRTSSDEERNTTNSRLSAFYSTTNIMVPIAISSIAELIGIREAFLLLLMPVVLACFFLFRSFQQKERPSYLANYSWSSQGEADRQPDHDE